MIQNFHLRFRDKTFVKWIFFDIYNKPTSFDGMPKAQGFGFEGIDFKKLLRKVDDILKIR